MTEQENANPIASNVHNNAHEKVKISQLFPLIQYPVVLMKFLLGIILHIGVYPALATQ